MTEETFDRICEYASRRCPQVGGIFLAKAKVVVDEEVPADEPIFAESPAPPEIRLSMSDFVELDRRLLARTAEEEDERETRMLWGGHRRLGVSAQRRR